MTIEPAFEKSHEPNTRSPTGFGMRVLGLCYGAVAYTIFLATFLYAIGFVSGIAVPKTVNSGVAPPISRAILVNILLLGVFAIQHSGMARRAFKDVLTRYVAPAVERSTYVLAANAALILLFWFWQPMPSVVWQIADPTGAALVQLLAAFGWLIVLYSTFLISHFELFGLKQVVLNFVGRTAPDSSFKAPALYRFVRHPIYLGFIIAFWATPVMTVGHLLFAAVTTAYIFIGITLEERDLIAIFGDEYRRYRAGVAMLLPRIF
jgi:methanethiol S-methyltransferase